MTVQAPRLVVTTSLAAQTDVVDRARAVASACGGQFRPRRGGLPAWWRGGDFDLLYVVSAEGEQLRDAQEGLSVHEGLLKLKRAAGRTHPLLRAIAPLEGAPVPLVLDATLGMAQDALHIAAMLPTEVLGFEASRILATLTQAGLRKVIAQRPRWSDAAKKVQVEVRSSRAALAEMAPDSVPVVFLDPMFDSPLRAPPGYALLRRCAEPDPLDSAWLKDAVRVAQRRVVLKLPWGSKLPDIDVPSPGFNRRICGKVIDYVVIEKELSDPVWEAPRQPRNYPYRAER